MMPTLLKRFVKNWVSFAAIKWAKGYIKKDRSYSYKGLKIAIHKDVFHPGLFHSTKVMINWLTTQHLDNKNVLELGCGSGLISMIAAQHGSKVTAVDINPKAVTNAKINANKNKLVISCYQSNLFSAIPQYEYFDYVLINPPYFPGDASTDYDHAWYCGKDFNYFHELFDQLQERSTEERYYMILSDNCDLNTINSIAKEKKQVLKEVYRKKTWGETFFIYQVLRDQ